MSRSVHRQLLFAWASMLVMCAAGASADERPAVNRDTVKIAAVQISGYDKGDLPRVGYDPTAQIIPYIDRAGKDAAQLVVFPEYVLGRITVPGPETQRISAAAKANAIYVIVGCWEVFADETFANSALIFDRSGEIVGKYRKTHAAIDHFEGSPPWANPPAGQSREWMLQNDPEWIMEAGTELPVFDFDFGRVGVMTCYDGWFPEPARVLSLKGAELLVWINGRGGSVEDFILKSTIFQSHVAMVATNQAYGSGTMIGDSSERPAHIIARTPDKQEAYISGTINLKQIRQIRANSRNFQQRRPDLYGSLAETKRFPTPTGPAEKKRADAAPTAAPRPNIVVIFTDDQGYGDLGCYGSESIRTPRIDQLAKEGIRFTSFYAQIVCGPSRSALLTGRYPIRSQGWSMPGSEITVAELLKEVGYTTGCIGKWDVSNRQPILDRMPNAQGFDFFRGTLGANDNGRVIFHENNERIGESSDMAALTQQYTDNGIEFLKQNKERPFFLYLAHTMVHSVIDASPAFKGKSAGGLYGDTVEELDFHTGRLLDAIDDLGLRDNTLVIFTTDNGPWSNAQDALRKKHNGQIAWGSSGPLREAKGSTYEGGLRVPCIARWPGRVPADVRSDAIFATIDFLPTIAALTGFSLPTDRLIDGVNQTDLLLGRNPSGARHDYAYFCQGELQAVRRGPWKLLKANRTLFYPYVKDRGSADAELYNLSDDIGETQNVAEHHPEIVRELQTLLDQFPVPETPYDARITIPPPGQ